MKYRKTQYLPYPWIKPTFGVAVQYTEEDDTLSLLTMDQVDHMQRVIGRFYYYARAVDRTMLTVLGELASTQILGTATQQVSDNIFWFLNYTTTHPDAKIYIMEAT